MCPTMQRTQKQMARCGKEDTSERRKHSIRSAYTQTCNVDETSLNAICVSSWRCVTTEPDELNKITSPMRTGRIEHLPGCGQLFEVKRKAQSANLLGAQNTGYYWHRGERYMHRWQGDEGTRECKFKPIWGEEAQKQCNQRIVLREIGSKKNGDSINMGSLFILRGCWLTLGAVSRAEEGCR